MSELITGCISGILVVIVAIVFIVIHWWGGDG